ncbi:hypothetical protein Val02_71220 [Virgisporangium aliadipatigenens]|uniref:Uncharacterized protein n=1 Tax=Virgisporangium aliadipatigenens TaxID=741659 RepID=A0A8J3YRP3_9ACTN|nr:hypothetical protein [Virgisporangium aliadipatigenens]GIJ50236.1 hypothetical protein Val02_71220 [Virgisporangium aliadipatigenens]
MDTPERDQQLWLITAATVVGVLMLVAAVVVAVAVQQAPGPHALEMSLTTPWRR